MKSKNFNVAFLAVRFKVYPAIYSFVENFLKEQKGSAVNTTKLVEIFKFDENKNPYEIEFNMPVG